MRYLIVPPNLARSAARCGLPAAHAAYWVSESGRLRGAPHAENGHGGLMVVGEHSPKQGDPRLLARELAAARSVGKHSGIVCDFDPPPKQLLWKTIQALAAQGIPLWVTEGYAKAAANARVLIPSALSGGSLAQRLAEAGSRYGTARLALGVLRSRLEFRLPARDGRGAPISVEELMHLRRNQAAAVFFSPELCAKYFTYRPAGGGLRMVLFDDGESILEKLKTAEQMGIRDAFLAYPEVEDLPELWRGGHKK